MSQRLKAFRKVLSESPYKAYLLFNTDAHGTEYLQEADKRIAYLSGFTGSAATCIISKDSALLWTDGRYFTQAAQELSSEWTLCKAGLPETLTLSQWLRKHHEGDTIGVDYTQTTSADLDRLSAGGVKFEGDTLNLVDGIWENRPQCQSNPLYAHEFPGDSVATKYALLREKMSAQKVNHMVLTHLEDLAWFLNIRGSDISFCPIFFGYALVGFEETLLFIRSDESAIDAQVKQNLGEANVKIRPYDDFFAHLKTLETTVWVDPTSSLAVSKSIQNPQLETLPLEHLRSIKSPSEVEAMTAAHIRDGVALCKYLAWLERRVASGPPITEWEASEYLDALRLADPDCISLSFATISGAGPNGAIIHYRAQQETARQIGQEMYLVDSGGQFRQGTTDVTRMSHFGTPSEYEKASFTRVLRGHIALSQAVFPKGTPGPALDVLARQYLWQAGQDYMHGTGHGVGNLLMVHEGPIGIGKPTPNGAVRLKYGMVPGIIVSNEPGYYEPGNFGIRIESLQVVEPVEGHPDYCQFRTLTMCPIEQKLIDWTALSADELGWLQTYHRQVYDRISPFLTEDYELEWLSRQCKAGP